MTFRVVIQRLAQNDLSTSYWRAANRAPVSAARWLDRFEKAIHSLKQTPQRCPLAREDSKVDVELRELLFGKRPFVFRVLFVIDGDTVRVLRIRRAQRRYLTAAQLKEALEWNE